MSTLEPMGPREVTEVTLTVCVKCASLADAMRLRDVLRANGARLARLVIRETGTPAQPWSLTEDIERR